MPAKTEMTWEPATRRWKKIYKGRAYTISCRALGVPATKLDSYQAANAWWLAKRIEIDSNSPPHPNARYLGLLADRLAWARAHGRDDLARSLNETIEQVVADQSGTQDGSYDGPMDLPSVVMDVMDNANWQDRLAVESVALVPQDRTVGAQVTRYLDLEQTRTETGQLSASEFDTIRRCLLTFRDWLGGANPIEHIDADRWEAWWSHLMSQTISTEYKKKRLRIARTFISWLAEKGLIPSPPNLHSRRHRFGGGAKSVPTMSLDEIRKLISAAPGQLKLHLLLMINCGMTQVDISELHPREVDWDRGRIRRKRSKTSDHKNVPVVEYPLWPETWKQLRKFGHRDGDRVLLTESGREWLRDELKPHGKRSKVDAIKSNYAHLQRKTKIERPLKLLRKTSATLLESHELYGRYKGHFLGHAPRSLAEKHYAAPSNELFDVIIGWLGDQYGPAVSGMRIDNTCIKS
jgi:integrase